MATAAEVFTEIDSRLKSDPSKIGSLTATYAFDLDGDNYHIVLKDGQGEAGAGEPPDPNITITMKADDFVDLATGKLDGTMAFMSGKLKIKGDMGLAMKLQGLLRNNN
jgi:putative sterol carrier protein